MKDNKNCDGQTIGYFIKYARAKKNEYKTTIFIMEALK